MMNQNKEYEDMPVKEKKKKQELREAGMDVNGEFGYYDGIYHEPAGIRVICKGNDGQIK